MSRTSTRTSLILFAATLSVALPAAWEPIVAKSKAINRSASGRPVAQTVAIGDASVSVEVDRESVEPGGEVTLALVGTASETSRVTAEVTVLRQSGDMMSRMPSPPVTVASKKVEIVAKEGGGPAAKVSFKLAFVAGRAAKELAEDPVSVAGQSTRYMLLVRKAGDDSGAAAAATVLVRQPEAMAITIEPPAELRQGETQEATLVIKNLTGKTLKDVTPYLRSNWAQLERADGSSERFEIAGGKEIRVRFKGVLAGEKGDVTLHADAIASYGGSTQSELVMGEDGAVSEARTGLAQVASLGGLGLIGSELIY